MGGVWHGGWHWHCGKGLGAESVTDGGSAVGPRARAARRAQRGAPVVPRHDTMCRRSKIQDLWQTLAVFSCPHTHTHATLKGRNKKNARGRTCRRGTPSLAPLHPGAPMLPPPAMPAAVACAVERALPRPSRLPVADAA